MTEEKSADPGTEFDQPAKPMHFGGALALSLVLFNSGFVVSQALRWTNHFLGLLNGLFQTIFFSFGWCMFFLPWSLGVLYCFGKKVDKGRRTQWILAPAWLVLILVMGGLAFDFPTVEKRFERFAKVDFPSQVGDLNTHFMGGGFMDYSDTYYFKASSSEIERIIKEKEMMEDTSFGKHGISSTIIKPLPGSPNFKNWEGAKQYKWFDSRHHWFAYLITDSAKTQAYIFIGCT